jgi:hypothetical protein
MHRRRGPLWGRRYKAILVSQEEAAQAGRFRYVLAHSVKEGLVAHARAAQRGVELDRRL